MELRGYLDGELADVQEFARAVEPFGLVLASVADDDYDPFTTWSI